MQLNEAITLIRCNALENSPSEAVWADLGCGSGLFSHALTALLPSGSQVYAVDKAADFNPGLSSTGAGNILPLQYDFVRDDLPFRDLDGLLMANAIHYVPDKGALLDRLKRYLKPHAPFLIVEYDTDKPVPVWVPYPLSFAALTTLSRGHGFHSVEKLGQRPSRFGRGNIYAALLQF